MEICICAAIKFKKNDEVIILRGHRHCDCFYVKYKRHDKSELKEVAQGFITSENRFVGREEGLELQKKAGIKSIAPGGYRGDQLFSEDLY